MRLKRFLASLGILLLGVVGALVVTEAPAAAHESDGCHTGQLCTYWNIGFGTPMYFYTYPAGACVNVGGGWNNQISSLINLRSGSITLYDNFYCDASAGSVSIDGIGGFWTHHVDALGSWPYLFNDRTSSIRFN